MRLVIQRVNEAELWIDEQLYSKIGTGIVALHGVGHEDTEKEIDYLVDKMMNLRIFPDENGQMNLSLKDVNGEVLIVSQFTLYGDCRKGRRPSYSNAMKPELAEKLYDQLVTKAKRHGVNVETGKFGAMMDVKLTNNGPVTLMLDSSKIF